MGRLPFTVAPNVLCRSSSGLATILAVIGLYGVMSYMVMRRARDIGIRIALGAQRGRVIGIVMREVFVLAGAGIAVGLQAGGLIEYVEGRRASGARLRGDAERIPRALVVRRPDVVAYRR